MPKEKAEKPKVVLDSNVFISALVFGGKPREILDLAIRGRIEIAVSDDILEEIKRVLGEKKFQYPAKIVRALINEIEELADIVESKEIIDAVQEDQEDNRVLIKIMNPDGFLRRPRKN